MRLKTVIWKGEVRGVSRSLHQIKAERQILADGGWIHRGARIETSRGQIISCNELWTVCWPTQPRTETHP